MKKGPLAGFAQNSGIAPGIAEVRGISKVAVERNAEPSAQSACGLIAVVLVTVYTKCVCLSFGKEITKEGPVGTMFIVSYHIY